jgi:predicted ATPase
LDLPDAEGQGFVANLSQKSLVATNIGGEISYHHMLDTTRAYALEKLSESAETIAITRRYANYYCNLLAAAPNDTLTVEFAGCAREIDNIRAALTWAFSPEGDISAGEPPHQSRATRALISLVVNPSGGRPPTRSYWTSWISACVASSSSGSSAEIATK